MSHVNKNLKSDTVSLTSNQTAQPHHLFFVQGKVGRYLSIAQLFDGAMEMLHCGPYYGESLVIFFEPLGYQCCVSIAACSVNQTTDCQNCVLAMAGAMPDALTKF